MTSDRFDALVAAWIQAEAPQSAPADLHSRAMAVVRAREAQAKWRSTGARRRGFFPPVVRSRIVYVAAAVTLILALLATLVAGATLLRRQFQGISNGAIAYTVGRSAVAGAADGQDSTFVNLADGGVHRVIGLDGRPSSCASFSPDGSQLAWWSDDSQRGLVLVVGDANGDRAESIPTATVESVFPADGGPVWSPDGRHIAYVPWDVVNGGTSLEVVEVTTKDVVVVPLGVGRVETPRWSPDGRRIAFVSGGRDLIVADADGENAHAIATLDRLELSSWSPDGQWLLFDAISRAYALSGAFVVRPDGSDLRDLSSPGASNRFPVWSPDSRRVAYIRGDTIAGGSGYSMQLVNVDGSETRTIRPDIDLTGSIFWSLAWSPDGKRIATIAYPPDANVSFSKGTGEIVSFSADGSADWSTVVAPSAQMWATCGLSWQRRQTL